MASHTKAPDGEKEGLMIGYVKIGERTFEYNYCARTGELVSNSVSYNDIMTRSANREEDLDLFYNKASATKYCIWCDWVEWAREHNANLWINGANCMTFSIVGTVIDNDGMPWNLYITKSHWRATPVIDVEY